MKEWLAIFQNESNLANIKLNGVTLGNFDYQVIDADADTVVFKVNKQKLCFIVPKKEFSQANWDFFLNYEKSRSDELLSLGLKARSYDIVPLTVCSRSAKSSTLSVLVTQDVPSLCQEQRMFLYDPRVESLIGTPIPILGSEFTKDMVQQWLVNIVQDFIKAITFSLPTAASDAAQASCEYYTLTSPERVGALPELRYMFWNIPVNSRKIRVPTYAELTLSLDSDGFDNSSPIFKFARNLAKALVAMVKPSNPQSYYSNLFYSFYTVLTDTNYLNQAITAVQTIAKDYIVNQTPKNKAEFKQLIEAAISTNDFASFEKVMKKERGMTLLDIDDLKQLKNSASYYQNKQIEDYLAKSMFLIAYKSRLMEDKASWCGLYGFFARSFVNDAMSFDEIRDHAMGKSKQGSGARSKQVMLSLGLM